MRTVLRQSAFADPELPAAIAMLLILVAILFPVFSQAHKKAQQAHCLSNEHELGLSLLLYMQDYDETQPRYQNDVAHTSWREDIQPYLKKGEAQPGAFACPSNPNGGLFSRDNPETRNDDAEIHVSYALNNNDANGVGGACARNSKATPLARIASPGQVIGMVESTGYQSDFVVTARVEGDRGAFHATDKTGKTGHLFTGHLGRSNFWLMDGHVKSLKPLDTMNRIDPGNSKASGSPLNLWTIDNSSFTDQDHTLSNNATPFTFARKNLLYSQSVDQ